MHDENQRGIVSRRNGRCKPAYNAGLMVKGNKIKLQKEAKIKKKYARACICQKKVVPLRPI